MWWLCGLLLAAAAAGCSRAPENSSAGDTLIYGRGGDANTLDPIRTDIGEAVKVMTNLYDTLITYDEETTELVPSLATSWSASEDGREWTFKLRNDVLFHDGTKLDADAVVFSIERLLASGDGIPRPYQPNYRIIENVTAADKHTVVFRLKEPSAVFLQNMAMFPASIVSPAAVEKHGDAFSTNPVGTGPFKFASWQRNQWIKLEAFDDHWRGGPGVAQLIFLSVSENATRAQQLRRGESHIADDLSPSELDALADTPGMVVQQETGLNVAYLSMQMEKEPLNHRDVRLAIAQAIDKQALIKIAYGGKAEPAVNMSPPDMWGYNDQIKDRPYDVAKARQLLEECAKREGFSLPLELSLAMMNQPRPYMPQPEQVGSFIKDSLAEIGIRVTLEPRTVNEHFEHVMAGRHQLALAGWQTDNNDIDNFLYSLLDIDNISDKGNNLSRYRNDRVHELLLAGQRESDPEKRLPLYLEAQELIFEDVPTVPLAHAQFRVAHTARLKGYRLHPTGIVRLRLAHFEDAK